MNLPIDITEPEITGAERILKEPHGGVGWSSFRLFYAVIVLTLVYCFAFVDRQIFNLLVAPIRQDFGVTDLQVGYLLGPAFILSYVALGIPAGWCADRFNRRDLILAAGACWGVGTVGGAFAHGYGGLFVSRLCVGASEAFLYPAGMSFIADLFDRKRLPIGTSIFLTAPALGGGLALVGGGLVLNAAEKLTSVHIPLLGAIRGWQTTLLVVGVVGMIPVLLMATVPDVARRRRTTPTVVKEQQYGFADGTAYMLRRWRFYITFFFGMACSSLVMLTISAWAPTYLSRTFHLSPAEIGTRYGVLVLLFGLAGGIASPMINAWVARRRPIDSTMWTVVLGPCMLVLFAALLCLARSQTMAMICLALLTFSYSFPMSMASTSLQIAAPQRLRGAASAWYFVIVSLLGYGIGPTAVPFVAEKILHDPSLIGEAMSGISVVFGILAIVLLLIALRGFRAEINRQNAG